MFTILYFSPNGNTKYLAKVLATELGSDSCNLKALEFTDPSSIEQTNHIILLYSIHAFNAPRTVKRFVKALPANLCKDISIISVGCTDIWINSAASMPIKEILIKKGYAIALDELVAMPLTLVMKFPEALRRKIISNAEKKMVDFAKDISLLKKSNRVIPLPSKLIQKIGLAEDGAARLFGLELHANNRCTSCGTCERNCPERNIVLKNKEKPRFAFNCILCLRCIYNCPEKAIAPRFSKFIPIKGGYVLKEGL